jgi:hypothetical protein
MTILHFGRRPAVYTRRTMRSALVMAKALNTLGPAPASSNDYMAAVTVPWGMLLNDTLGDCVCADQGHTLMLRTANTGTLVTPTDNDIQALYEAVGGYDPAQIQPDGSNPTDQGCVMTAMANYMETTGLLGHKADAVGTVDPSNLDHVRWCIQLFGSCSIGINFPAWAMDAFNAGQVWGAPPSGADTTIVGEHDIPLVDCRGGTFTCVTWGKGQLVDPTFLGLYCEEAHSELFFDWTSAQGVAPNNLSLDQLFSDLAAIGPTPTVVG